MSAQRNQRSGDSRTGKQSPSADAPSRGANDWEKTQGGAQSGVSPSRRASPDEQLKQQNQSSWNVRQNPEHPERPADGGQREMRGNAGSMEQQSGDPASPDQPESGDRGRHPESRRRSES